MVILLPLMLTMMMTIIMTTTMMTIITNVLVTIIVGRFFPEAQVSRMDFKPLMPGGTSSNPFDSNNGMISQVM